MLDECFSSVKLSALFRHLKYPYRLFNLVKLNQQFFLAKGYQVPFPSLKDFGIHTFQETAGYYSLIKMSRLLHKARNRHETDVALL